MYIIAGHSAALSFVMEERLYDEISRGFWWFFGSLLGGTTILFTIFTLSFERNLHVRITRPIQKLSMEIKDPRGFMANRSKATDVYTRRETKKN